MHSLLSVCSLVAILFFFLFSGIQSLLIFLITMSFWFIFHFWMWIGLVKTVWKSGSARLGVWIFRFLQVGVFVMLILVAVPSILSVEEFKILLLVILVFDVVIAWLLINFLFLAWFARCKISFRSYCEIGSIIVMIIIQVWLLNK